MSDAILGISRDRVDQVERPRDLHNVLAGPESESSMPYPIAPWADPNRLLAVYQADSKVRDFFAHNLRHLRLVHGGYALASQHRLAFDPRSEYWWRPGRRAAVWYLADKFARDFAPPKRCARSPWRFVRPSIGSSKASPIRKSTTTIPSGASSSSERSLSDCRRLRVRKAGRLGGPLAAAKAPSRFGRRRGLPRNDCARRQLGRGQRAGAAISIAHVPLHRRERTGHRSKARVLLRLGQPLLRHQRVPILGLAELRARAAEHARGDAARVRGSMVRRQAST